MEKDSVKVDGDLATFYVKTVQTSNNSVLTTYYDTFLFKRVEGTWYLNVDFDWFAKKKGFIK